MRMLFDVCVVDLRASRPCLWEEEHVRYGLLAWRTTTSCWRLMFVHVHVRLRVSSSFSFFSLYLGAEAGGYICSSQKERGGMVCLIR